MMIEWSKHVGAYLSLNVNNLSVCIGWCADQVTMRSARFNDKDSPCIYNFPYGIFEFKAVSLWKLSVEQPVSWSVYGGPFSLSWKCVHFHVTWIRLLQLLIVDCKDICVM